MPRRLAVENETLTDRYGRFSAQPFERGFGTTIGNSLRRARAASGFFQNSHEHAPGPPCILLTPDSEKFYGYGSK